MLIIYADFDPGRLVTLAKAARDYQTATHRIHTIHNWIDEKKAKKSGGTARTYAAISGNRVVFAQKQARVAQALDAMDRISANLAGDADVHPISVLAEAPSSGGRPQVRYAGQ